MTTAASRRIHISTKQALGVFGGLLGLFWVVMLATHTSDQLPSAIFGVGEGAVVAAIAISVTLTYRGSGVVNFAAAAVSMFAAFIFYDLRYNGKLFLPPPLPTFQLAHVRFVTSDFLPPQPVPPLPVWAAAGITLGACVVLGAIFHFLVFRPLRAAPPLAKVVASIGLLIVLQESATLRFPAAEPVDSILPSSSWYVGSVAIPQNTVILLALVVGIAAILWAVFKFTQFGLATRAAAENERGALILGYNPNRYAGVNWIVSTVLAGMFGILFASVNGSVDPLTITVLIVPALAASLLGRFSSFPVTVVAAVLLGSSESWLRVIGSQSWSPAWLQGQDWTLNDVLPFLVILLVLYVGGERLPTRGSDATMRMPRAPAPKVTFARAAPVFVIVGITAFLLNPDWRLALQVSIIASIVCASLVVLTGFVGQISLMQMTIAGVAGLVLSKVCDAHGIPFPIGPLLAAGVATLAGLVAAIPALRIRGVNLAVVTLSAAVVIEQFVYNLPIFQSGLSQSSQTNIKSPSFLWWHFGPQDPWSRIFGHPAGTFPNPWFSIFCLIVAAAVIASVVWIRRSRLGRQMLAVRSNERAAAAAGVSVSGTKVLAFAISAFIAGIAGCMFSYSFQAVDPLYFSSFNSLVFLAVAYLGGIAMVGGAPVGGTLAQGALFATFLATVVHIDSKYAVLIAGVGLVFASINNPEGITGSIMDARAKARARQARRRPEAGEAPHKDLASHVGTAV